MTRMTHAQRAAARGQAHGQLLSEISRLEDLSPGRVPCQGPQADAWISDHASLAKWAGAQCDRCPALTACTTYVTAWPEPGGTWAGRATRKTEHQTMIDLEGVA